MQSKKFRCQSCKKRKEVVGYYITDPNQDENAPAVCFDCMQIEERESDG